MNVSNGKTDVFKQKVAVKFGTEYVVLGGYVKNNILIQMKHTNCGNTFFTRPNGLLMGKGDGNSP